MKNVVLLEDAYPPYSTPYFVYTEYLGPKLQTPIISPGPPALSLWNTAHWTLTSKPKPEGAGEGSSSEEIMSIPLAGYIHCRDQADPYITQVCLF